MNKKTYFKKLFKEIRPKYNKFNINTPKISLNKLDLKNEDLNGKVINININKVSS